MLSLTCLIPDGRAVDPLVRPRRRKLARCGNVLRPTGGNLRVRSHRLHLLIDTSPET